LNYEIVWIGHDNFNAQLLKADDIAVDLSGVISMSLAIEELAVDLVINSTNVEGDPIRWAQAGYQTGEIRLFLGDQAIPARRHKAKLAVYDSSNPNGILWGYIWLDARTGVPASASS